MFRGHAETTRQETRVRNRRNENEGGSRFNSRGWLPLAYSEVLRRMPGRCYAKTVRAAWSALSIFRRYFRQYRIRRTSGGTVAYRISPWKFPSPLSFTRICIISFNCYSFSSLSTIWPPLPLEAKLIETLHVNDSGILKLLRYRHRIEFFNWNVRNIMTKFLPICHIFYIRERSKHFIKKKKKKEWESKNLYSCNFA